MTTQHTDLSTAPPIATGVEPTPHEVEAIEKSESRRGLLWRRFRRSKTAMFGTVVFVLLVILAIIGPRYIAQWGYDEVDRGPTSRAPAATRTGSAPPRTAATCSPCRCAVSASR